MRNARAITPQGVGRNKCAGVGSLGLVVVGLVVVGDLSACYRCA